MANQDLPHDLMLEIFSRLPAKSVGRCKILSKSWKADLSTSDFVKKHLLTRKQTIQQVHLALISEVYKLCIITSPTKEDEVFKDKSGDDAWWLDLFGSCNGLVLSDDATGLILVNPITSKKVTIQHKVTTELKNFGSYYSDYICGLGYDSSADDYKIVKITFYFSLSMNDSVVRTYVDVYSVKKGFWKSIDTFHANGTGLLPNHYASQRGAFVNGALHWLICNEEGYRNCISAFDLCNEVFHEIPFPKEFVRQLDNDVDDSVRPWRESKLSAVDGCLVIVDNHGNGATDVWMMKEYGVAESWIKFRIESEDGVCKWNMIVETLCYVKDGELLCLTGSKYIFACDLKCGTVRKVVIGNWDGYYIHGMTFVDSLVSPDGSS